MRKPFFWGEAAMLLGLGVLGLLLIRLWLTGLRPAAQSTACTINLRQLHLAVEQYEQANNGFLPPTDSAASFDAALLPYVATPSVLRCPDTGQPYIPNPAFSRRYFKSILGDLDTVVLAQQHVHADVIRAVHGRFAGHALDARRRQCGAIGGTPVT